MNINHRFQVTVIYNPPPNEEQNREIFLAEADTPGLALHIANSLKKFGYKTNVYEVSKKNLYYLKKKKADAFFNLCDGDGMYMKVVKQLARHGKVFTGPGPEVMELTVDKIATKKVFEKAGVPTPKWQFFRTLRDRKNRSLRYPLIVKPYKEDCSIGIGLDSIVHNSKELRKKVAEVKKTFKQGVLVEEFIPGIEIHCTVVGNGDDIVALPLTELTPEKNVRGPFVYDYTTKWEQQKCKYGKILMSSPPASIGKRVQKKIMEQAKQAFIALEMKDYARFDLRYSLRRKKWYFLEANANPSLENSDEEATIASMKAFGMKYETLIHNIFNACIRRNTPSIQHASN